MSLIIAKDALLYIGAPMLKSIITEIIKSNTTDEELQKIKSKFLVYLTELTSKTENKIDDVIVLGVFDFIVNSEQSKEIKNNIIDLIKGWVSNTSTKWDDTLINPILDELKK